MFQLVQCSAAMESIRGPLEPIISGIFPGRGSSTRSSARVVRAREREALAGQRAADDLERLLEARHPLVVRDAERVELALVPARAEAEHEPPAADLVDRRGHLGDQPRRVKADAGHQRADRHARRDRRQRGHQRPHLPRALVLVEQVVAEPDRVEARLLGGDRHRPVLGPADLSFDLRKLNSDAHTRARYARAPSSRPAPRRRARGRAASGGPACRSPIRASPPR